MNSINLMMKEINRKDGRDNYKESTPKTKVLKPEMIIENYRYANSGGHFGK
jgi:hypothetical protein